MLQNRQHRIINTEFDKKKKRFAKIRRGIAEFCHPPLPPFPPSQKNENSAEKTKQNARNSYQKLWSCLCSSLTLVIDRDETTNRFLSSPFFASFFLLLLLFPLFPPPSLFPNSRVIDSRTTSGMPPIESGSRRSVASHTTWLTDSACPTARVFIFICRWPVAPVYYFRGNYVFEPCLGSNADGTRIGIQFWGRIFVTKLSSFLFDSSSWVNIYRISFAIYFAMTRLEIWSRKGG